jgi:uncharacterized protein with ATP-grasp and redox domains
MKTSVDCIPCLLRQASDALKLSKLEPENEMDCLRDLLRTAASLDFSLSPPVLSGALQARLRELTTISDPFLEAKQRFNRLALELLPQLAEAVTAARDPFAAAVQLAIAGNVIDLGAKSGLDDDEVRHTTTTALAQPLVGDLSQLQKSAESARRILYLCDNAGEIVFDRVLIQQLPLGAVTVAVRGRPVLNDATYDDAVVAELSKLARVIDNGSDVPGTFLMNCSTEFQKQFKDADLIIAKGQGNFETLHAERGRVFCLFRVKCQSVAQHCGHPIGSHVVWLSS